MKFYQIISFISYHFLHREVHKVSPYKYNKYLGESRQGVRGKIHGNTGSIKPSIEHTGNLLFWYKKKIMICLMYNPWWYFLAYLSWKLKRAFLITFCPLSVLKHFQRDRFQPNLAQNTLRYNQKSCKFCWSILT